MAKQTSIDEERFNAEVQKQLGDIEEELKSTVRIAIVGKVSTGKSSLLNALFKRSRNNILAKVMATSGVTTECQSFSLGKNIEIIDSPGLGDVIKENSQITLDNLNSIDVGILVVSDSVDVSQKGHYDELSLHCKKVFVVLNKIDLYDKKKAALEKVVQQWHEVLGLKDDEKIFQTCADGYDPETDDDVELDIRGVDELRKEIFAFLKEHGKYLVLAREIEEKSTLVKEVIVACMVAAAGFAFIPGSSVYITVTQAAAIIRIHYIYTGEVINKDNVTALIPLFFSWSAGSSTFLAVKSFVIIPTGVLDVAAAGIAMGVTLAMLSTVNWMYKNGYNFKDNKGEIEDRFKKFYKTLQDINLSEIWNIVKTRDSVAIMALTNKFVKD